MSTFTASFRSEVARLAKREVKQSLESLKRASARHRKEIASLKREIVDLRKQLRRSTRSAAADAPEATGRPIRFRADGLKALRAKLGLSAADFGALVGVTGQTVYNWESGVKPRQAQLERIVALRGIGKREARARLEQAA